MDEREKTCASKSRSGNEPKRVQHRAATGTSWSADRRQKLKMPILLIKRLVKRATQRQ
jgi:hypothetical protein